MIAFLEGNLLEAPAEALVNTVNTVGMMGKGMMMDADMQKQRVRKALEDNLQTSRDRLTNLHRARDNFDLVKLEIDRLENKIQSLSELAVNRQEPDYISGQVDQVAASMLETENTMNELRFVTGLDSVDEAPSLLQGDVVKRTREKQLH